MPSVYNYRHVELDKVGRGKRVIQPPGGQTADIFGIGRSSQAPSEAGGASYHSSASSQAGSDVASSRVHIETMSSSGVAPSSANVASMDGTVSGSASAIQSGQVSPSGSVGSASTSGNSGQQLLMAGLSGQPQTAQRIQSSNSIQQQKLMQIQQANDANRSPKKTIPVLRRNPITGEVLADPGERQQAPIRVRQPPGGRSSGIF